MSTASKNPHARGAAPSSYWMLAVLYAIAAALAVWTWRKWPDVYVDFGRELYVAWRVSQGDRLHEQIATFNGPLSSYFNGTLFRVFGASFTTLIVANLALLGLLITLLFVLFRRCAGALSATVAGLVFVIVFAFSQFVATGNYNYVTPYSHELTHGVILGVLSICAIERWAATSRVVWLALCGVCVGLTFLTKTEVFASTAVATIAGITLTAKIRGDRWRGVSHYAAYAAGVLLPVLVAVGTTGAEATMAPWALLFRSGVAADPFYKKGMGLDFPRENFLLFLGWSGIVVALVGAAILVGRRFRQATRKTAAILLVISAAAAVVVFQLPGEEFWQGGGDSFRCRRGPWRCGLRGTRTANDRRRAPRIAQSSWRRSQSSPSVCSQRWFCLPASGTTDLHSRCPRHFSSSQR